MCLQLFILGLLPDFFPWQQAVTEQETLMFFFLQTISERPKRQRLLWLPRSSSTTVLSKSVTICWNCQGLQSSEAKNCGFVPQSLAEEELGWRDEGQTIHQFDLRTLLDRRLLLLDCDCELLPSCTKTSPKQVSPKFQSSLPHGSHTAPGALLTSITVARCVWKSWSKKKVNHWESHKHDRNIMPSWLDSAPRLETFHIKARWSRKERKEERETKRKIEKTKGKRNEKRKRRKKKGQIEQKGNKRNSELDLNWFVI